MKSCRIICGAKNQGKTTHVLSLALSQGFASIRRDDCYILRNLATGEERILMTERPLFADMIGRWHYDQSVFDWANQILSSIGSGEVAVDETGRLEAGGGGFAPGIRALMKSDADIILSIRKDFIPIVLDAFSISEYTIEEIDR